MNEIDKESFYQCIDDLEIYAQLLVSINPEHQINTDVIQKVGLKLTEISKNLVEFSLALQDA